MPRKCLTEYKALVDEGNIESAFSVRRGDCVKCREARYGTPKSFIFYIDDIKKKLGAEESFTITVIDDIIVYGRGICQFLDRFLSFFSEEDANKVRKMIRVVAFVRNADIPFLQKKYPDIFGNKLMFKTYRTYSEPSDLKRISDLFLNSFAATMTPNISFVNTWVINADRGEGKLYHWLKERLSKKEENIYRDYVSHLNNYNKLFGLPCYCGHDCSKCVTYIATQTNNDDLRRQAQSFYKERFGLDIPLEKFHCDGGRSKNVFELCKECPFKKCCIERGIDACGRCPDYPCKEISDYQEKYVNKCNQLENK